MCSAKMPSLPAARFSGSLCSKGFIMKLLHMNSSIPSKLPCEVIFCCTKLPISLFFDEFSNAEKCFLHMTVTTLFPVSPTTVDGSHDFLLFLMFCRNFLGDLFNKVSGMASALHFCWDFRQALNAYLNSFLLSFIMSNRGPLLGLWLSNQYKYARRAALCFSLTSLFHPGTLCFCFELLDFTCCSFECHYYVSVKKVCRPLAYGIAKAGEWVKMKRWKLIPLQKGAFHRCSWNRRDVSVFSVVPKTTAIRDNHRELLGDEVMKPALHRKCTLQVTYRIWTASTGPEKGVCFYTAKPLCWFQSRSLITLFSSV